MSTEAVGPGSKGRRGPTSSSCAECKRCCLCTIIRTKAIDPWLDSRSSVRATKVGIGHVSTVQRGDALCSVPMRPCQSRHGGLWLCLTETGITDRCWCRGEAGVDALKRKNKQLIQRIKELEARLAAANKETPKDSSPAATSEGTAVDQEVESLTKDFGILKIEPDGRTSWHGLSRFPPADLPLMHIFRLSRAE